MTDAPPFSTKYSQRPGIPSRRAEPRVVEPAQLTAQDGLFLIEATQHRAAGRAEDDTKKQSRLPPAPGEPQVRVDASHPVPLVPVAELDERIRQVLDARAPATKSDVRSMYPLFRQVAPIVAVIAALAGGVYAVILVVVAAQSYMNDAVTNQAAPLRGEVMEQGRQLRSLDRKVDRILQALNVPDEPDGGVRP